MAYIESCPVCGKHFEHGTTVCPACGFKMVESTQKMKPIDVSGESEAHETVPAVKESPVAERSMDTAHLRIVHGPQIDTIFDLPNETISIGRSPKCMIFLNDMTVSRNHAFLEVDGGVYTIVDDASYNGIWINNDNVTAAVLKDGDIIQIGAFCLQFEQ